ncbi:MAG: C40 family peptidase [Aquisalimonadaceae bacterium]
MRGTTVPICIALLLAGCASTPPAPVYDYRPSAAVSERADRQSADGAGIEILRTAQAQLGTPYRYGGDHPDRGFDCSGLVAFSHGRHGIPVPRTAHAQAHQASAVDPGMLEAGDLVFFRLDGRRVSHVGIYAGDGRFIHAPKSGGRVSYASLDDAYWQRHLSGAGRFVSR